MSDTPIYDELKATLAESHTDEAEDNSTTGTDAVVPNPSAWTVPSAYRNGNGA